MKPKTPMNEALFRAHQSTEKVSQPQTKLVSMGNPDQTSYTNNAHHAPLNESHVNLMHSWMNLRGMDNELAETKYSDMNEKNQS